MTVVLWVLTLIDFVGVLVSLTLLGRMLRAGPATARWVEPVPLGERLPGAAAIRSHSKAQGPFVLVVGRRRCVGTFRIEPHFADLRAHCGVPVHVVHLDGDVKGLRVPAALARRTPRTPWAYYVDEHDVVRNVGLVDTLLALAHFTEGCPARSLREWPWKLDEWRRQVAADQPQVIETVATGG